MTCETFFAHIVFDSPHPIAAYMLNFMLSLENVSTTSMYKYRPKNDIYDQLGQFINYVTHNLAFSDPPCKKIP